MRTHFLPGALVASLAAGPLFVLPLLLGELTRPNSWQAIAFLPVVLLMAMIFGFLLAVVPNLVGAAVLVTAGRRWPAFRHPLTWAIAGAALGWAISVTLLRNPGGFGPAYATDALLTGVGLVCALISRRFAVWED